MRRICIALALAMMIVAPGVALAQSEGAVVDRGRADWEIGWVEYDGALTLIVFSTYPDFACNGAVSIPDRWQVVTTPTGAPHYTEHGRMFARAYEATLAELQTDPHAFLCGPREWWAEGILSVMWYDNDQLATAPGANVWGHTMNGSLRDLIGACKSGIVKVDVVHLFKLAPGDYPACLPDCYSVRVFKGPVAECVGK